MLSAAACMRVREGYCWKGESPALPDHQRVVTQPVSWQGNNNGRASYKAAQGGLTDFYTLNHLEMNWAAASAELISRRLMFPHHRIIRNQDQISSTQATTAVAKVAPESFSTDGSGSPIPLSGFK